MLRKKRSMKNTNHGKPLSMRLGRTGRFIGCTAFPDCGYTRSVDDDGSDARTAAEIIGDRKCPKDDAELVIKHGRYGKFIGCSIYPKCNFIEPLVKPRDTEVKCPKCNKGTILERKSKRGKIFFLVLSIQSVSMRCGMN